LSFFSGIVTSSDQMFNIPGKDPYSSRDCSKITYGHNVDL
jgi:hypothetical protein